VGVLVKTAQAVEAEIESIHRHLEPTFRIKMQGAKSEWLGLKNRGAGSAMSSWEFRLRGFVLRTDAEVRVRIVRFIGRIIIELEKMRRTMARSV
jgi:hypothetical protein